MSDLIERMADAIDDAAHVIIDCDRAPLLYNPVKVAHAALAALLPPDPAAVRRVAYETDITPETVAAIWTRMVELSGPPPDDSGP